MIGICQLQFFRLSRDQTTTPTVYGRMPCLLALFGFFVVLIIPSWRVRVTLPFELVFIKLTREMSTAKETTATYALNAFMSPMKASDKVRAPTPKA